MPGFLLMGWPWLLPLSYFHQQPQYDFWSYSEGLAWSANMLQHQILQGMCKACVHGHQYAVFDTLYVAFFAVLNQPANLVL